MAILRPSYGASVALASSHLQALASSTGGLAGWSSAVVDNTINLSVDEIITFRLGVGSSTPSLGGQIECWVWEVMNDTPTYPDTITGSEGAVTLTSPNVKASGAFKFGGSVITDQAANRVFFNTFRLSDMFGTSLPKMWGIFVQNSCGSALANTSNVVTRIPVQYTLSS